MRLIDADALMKRMATVYTDTDLRAHYNEIMRAIREQLTVDAVPVVRCKDCKWRKEEWKLDGNCWCGMFDRYTRETFFCADGDRRDAKG